MEVLTMARLLKVITLASLTSVTLMQTPCTFATHGFNAIPNEYNPLTGVTSWLSSLVTGLIPL